jgi:hypothetical protein
VALKSELAIGSGSPPRHSATRRGTQGGWRDVERLKVDPDLDAIRANADFQRIIKELQAPAGDAKH